MSRLRLGLALSLLVALCACTSGLFAGEAVEQKQGAELLMLQDTLSQGARLQATYHVENGRYTLDPNELGLSVPEGVSIAITGLAAEEFCMAGTHEAIPDTVWHITSDMAAPIEGGC